MNWLLSILIVLFTSDGDARALQRTAPQYLTLESAREHTIAARIGALGFDVDPDLLLATALRESNYQKSIAYRESSGTWSCGVVQAPTKIWRCREQTRSLVAGYAAGAAHLRWWMDQCRDNIHCALSGYAGGFVFIFNCRRNHGKFKRECSVPGERMRRANWIKKERLL